MSDGDSSGDESVEYLVAPTAPSSGAALMELLGWTGGGLGANEQGRIEPIIPEVKVKYAGLQSKPPEEPALLQVPKKMEPSEASGKSKETREAATKQSLLSQVEHLRRILTVAHKARQSLAQMPAPSHFIAEFERFWSVGELQSELEMITVALAAVRVCRKPLESETIMELEALRGYVSAEMVEKVVRSSWLPVALEEGGEPDVLDALLSYPWLAQVAGPSLASKIHVPTSLLRSWLNVLTDEPRRVLLDRCISDLAASWGPDSVGDAEELAEAGADLDDALSPLLGSWLKDAEISSVWSFIRDWCGPVSPNAIAALLDTVVFPRWTRELAIADLSLQQWLSWRSILPIELSSHPDVLRWIHVGLGIINSRLDGCPVSQALMHAPDTDTVTALRASFRDVLYAWAAANKIPLQAHPLKLRDIPARIIDDVLWLKRQDKWEPVSLDDIV